MEYFAFEEIGSSAAEWLHLAPSVLHHGPPLERDSGVKGEEEESGLLSPTTGTLAKTEVARQV